MDGQMSASNHSHEIDKFEDACAATSCTGLLHVRSVDVTYQPLVYTTQVKRAFRAF